LTAAEVAAVHADVVGISFAAFIPKVGMLLGSTANDDRFEAKATFTLGVGSDGIDPQHEQVGLQVGTFFAVIPAGSFQLSRNGSLKFEGVISGVSLKVKITPLGGGSFDFKAEGASANLSRTTLPVAVGLTIGNDHGRTALNRIEADLGPDERDGSEDANRDVSSMRGRSGAVVIGNSARPVTSRGKL
jgi:hypothetical protein